MKYFIKAFKNCVNYKGRSNRKEWIMFVIFESLFYTILQLITVFISLFFGSESNLLIAWLILCVIFIIVLGFPAISLQVRRLHDIGKSWHWLLLSVIPIVSLYVFYLLYIKAGDPYINEYGAPPHWDDTIKVNSKQSTTSDSTEQFESSAPVSDANIVKTDMPQNETPQIRYCRKCGFELWEGSEYCSKCGTKVIRG